MRQLDDPEVAAWIAKANGDLRMARLAASDAEPLFDQACFHAQQSAEKALKSLIVAFDLVPPRTHDLSVLLGVIFPVLRGVEELEVHVEVLSEYSVGPRYPSFLAGETAEEAAAAIAAAAAVLEWIVLQIRLDGSTGSAI